LVTEVRSVHWPHGMQTLAGPGFPGPRGLVRTGTVTAILSVSSRVLTVRT